MSSERSEVLCPCWTLPAHTDTCTLVHMTAKSKEPSAETLQVIRMYQDKLQEQEEQWKFTRLAYRQTLVLAVVEEGLSVAKVAHIAGIDRRMLTLWLQLHAAEEKGRADARK